MDKVTKLRRRVDFARICIKTDVLPDTIEVDIEDIGIFEVIVEYLWKPFECSQCNKFGYNN